MAFSSDGYAIRPLFGADEVARLRQAIGEHIERIARATLKPYAETHPGLPFDQRIERIAADDQSFAQLLGMAAGTDAFRDPAVAELANDPRLSELAADAAGCEIGDRIFRFRLNSSALPQGRQAWHSDVSRDDDTDCAKLVVTAWIPLSDAGPDSGGLELVPGRRRVPAPHDEAGKHTIPDSALAALSSLAPNVPAGHCLLLDRFTPHRALLNTSGRTRWSLVVWLKSRAPVAATGEARSAALA